MVKKGTQLICTIRAEDYRMYIGRIRSMFSRRIRMDIQRRKDDSGEKIVEIWSPFPEIVKPAVEKVLRK